MNAATINVPIQNADPIVRPAGPSKQAIAGLLGIFIAAMMAGLNNRVGSLGLVDIRGVLGASLDDASWLSSAYTVGELIAMPFASWFAITLSVRRFHISMVTVCGFIAAILPFIHNLDLLIALRFIQGVSSGALIPILMMAALKFLPPHIRLHGLALYAMTATFAPNLAIWLSGQWVDGLSDWRLIYWQVIPLCLVAGSLTAWGLPKEGVKYARFKEGNWLGLICGVSSLALIATALDQGVRLDWFNSSLITVCFSAGIVLFGCYLFTEWHHKTPFMKPQLIGKRNLGIGAVILTLLLVVFMSGSMLPSVHLTNLHNYRALQLAPIGLLIALPQLVLGSVVALFLYKKWVDARFVMAIGLFLISLACFSGTQITPQWHGDQFLTAQLLQAFGQPMAVVPILFLMTSVLDPSEGPYFSGTINTLRVFGSLIGGAVVGQLIVVRSRFHNEMLLDHASLVGNSLPQSATPAELGSVIAQQSLVLSIADAYLVLGIIALVLIPLALCMDFVPAPNLNKS
ncbi:MFS transporter [Pseudoalteromonas distincta]|uniref:MFS transporter n=1 Tax=Pseudoalteromonas distincta TaxID=77608 RepID=A0A4P9IYU2_9GAMM|nr:MFS transporter [Pseudoalteromonas distincta]KAA1163216.1 MFS transporter [Pseudoalteromonas distincta]QCU73404.1 MFS transporter [Pseudoalteromonas distincta]